MIYGATGQFGRRQGGGSVLAFGGMTPKWCARKPELEGLKVNPRRYPLSRQRMLAKDGTHGGSVEGLAIQAKGGGKGFVIAAPVVHANGHLCCPRRTEGQGMIQV